VSDASARRRHHLERALGIAISLIALAGVVWWALRQEAPSFPDDAQGWLLVVAALVVYLVETLARGWRWHVILRHAGIEHRARDAFGVTTIGYMGNTVLPARGGEVLRILVMADHSSGRRREILGSIIPERLLDVAALAMLFALAALIVAEEQPLGPAVPVIAVAVCVLGALVLYGYHRLRMRGHFESFAARIRPVAGASRLLITPWGAGLLLVSCAIWIGEGVVMSLCAASLGIGLNVAEAFGVVVLASFFALIPAAPGYVGTLDAAVLFGLKAADVTGSAALSVLLLYRFVVFVPITVVGLALLLARYGGLATLRSAERTADEGLVGEDPGVDVGKDVPRPATGSPGGV
jgi:uncharacterized membrane protein YbhN (UPF0104 family)